MIIFMVLSRLIFIFNEEEIRQKKKNYVYKSIKKNKLEGKYKNSKTVSQENINFFFVYTRVKKKKLTHKVNHKNYFISNINNKNSFKQKNVKEENCLFFFNFCSLIKLKKKKIQPKRTQYIFIFSLI